MNKDNKGAELFFIITVIALFALFYSLVIAIQTQNMESAEPQPAIIEGEPLIIYQLSPESQSKINNLEKTVFLLKEENKVLRAEKKELEQQLDQSQIEQDLSMDEMEMLYRVVRAEAGSWSEEGQKNVAKVVLNRVASDRFPNTIEEVIFQPSQFTVVSNGSFYKVEISDFTMENVEQAYEEWLDGSNAEGALFFHSGKKSSSRKYLFDDEVGHHFH